MVIIDDAVSVPAKSVLTIFVNFLSSSPPASPSLPLDTTEVLARYGNPAQQEKWLKPLLEGKTRSSFAMTEKGIASSDATNIRTSIKLDPKTDEIVINGHKWWISGAGDPRNALHLVLGKS